MSLADIAIDETHGWRRFQVTGKTVWVKGYVIEGERAHTGRGAAERLAKLPASPAALKSAMGDFDGLFAAVIKSPGLVIAVADRVASVPLLYGWGRNGIVFDSVADRLIDRLGRNAREVDPDGALAMAMSGFTIGSDTLYSAARRLQAGDFVIVSKAGVQTGRHYRYAAWEVEETGSAELARQLHAVLRRLFERLVKDLDGRVVVVPLSAGLDSRLIAAGLRELNYRHVKCFAYGLPGNYEARASREIAERLGYPWTFVPYGRKRQREAFASAEHDAYFRFADTYTAVPFEQDFLAVRNLTESGWLPPDAVVINGQTGDYITGGHIPPALQGNEPAAAGASWSPIIDAIIEKHHSLWAAMKTPANLDRIRALLVRDLEAAGAPDRPGRAAHGLFEFSEFENRQSKYVCGGQRVYEFFGLDWRMPLWESPFVEFWRTAPVTAKVERALFREVLNDLDWGGVWKGFKSRRSISPSWVPPLRLAAKLICAPLGRDAWHDFERRYFAYWMDILANYVVAPYPRVRDDRRGFRNAVSWLTEAYLAGKSLDWRGQPVAS